MKFDAGSFSEIAETETGRALWAFLNEREVLIRLETTTFLGRPALEGVQPQLIARFDTDIIKRDRWKQMMGRMTRQIMEEHGYLFDQSGVRIRVGNLFTSAARYKRA